MFLPACVPIGGGVDFRAGLSLHIDFAGAGKDLYGETLL